MMFRQGEIVVVPFPFSDLSGTKQRPVLILSKDVYNKNNQDVITCAITSNLKDSPHSIFIDNTNLIKGMIPKPSRVRIDKLFTIEKSIIKKNVAKIKNNVFEQVRKEFFKLV